MPYILNGDDLIAQAKIGSGKTVEVGLGFAEPEPQMAEQSSIDFVPETCGRAENGMFPLKKGEKGDVPLKFLLFLA